MVEWCSFWPNMFFFDYVGFLKPDISTGEWSSNVCRMELFMLYLLDLAREKMSFTDEAAEIENQDHILIKVLVAL